MEITDFFKKHEYLIVRKFGESVPIGNFTARFYKSPSYRFTEDHADEVRSRVHEIARQMIEDAEKLTGDSEQPDRKRKKKRRKSKQ